MYRTSARPLFAGLFLAVWLWPVVTSAQASWNLRVEQVRDSFVGAGFQVAQAHSWTWTSPPVTTLQVADRAGRRVLLARVYPDAAAAQTERAHALAHEAEPAGLTPVGYGPHLVPGYGPSLWRGNVALVQTTQSELDRLSSLQNDRDNGAFIDPTVLREPSPANYAVDRDFQQALDSSVVNL